MEVPQGFQVTEAFVKGTHGQLGCRTCHGGENDSDFKKAHQGLISDPAKGATGVCTQCHLQISSMYTSSFHAGQSMYSNFMASTGPDRSELTTAFYQHECAECHASCGDCHLQSGGSLHTGHEFLARPAIADSCLRCHQRGAAGEFIGEIDGMTTISDVHYRVGFDCLDCHSAEILHGSDGGEELAEVGKPCLTCHAPDLGPDSQIEAHRVHPEGLLDCRICHSLPAENCYNCHINANGPADVVTRLQWKIGLNSQPTADQPYRYCVVRHIPTRRDLLDDFAPELLPRYDERADWRVTAPHNIQRRTPQNKDCNSCHGVEARFLTIRDLSPDESSANQQVIVERVPSLR